MPEDKIRDPMIDVGEQEGAEVILDNNNEQTKAVAEEKIEVSQEEKPTIEVKEEKVEEKKPLEKTENNVRYLTELHKYYTTLNYVPANLMQNIELKK